MTQFRMTINIGLLDRPLTAGLLAALVGGQWPQCIGVAVFFELLWLDLFPAGTYIPPQRILSTLLVCSVVSVLHLSNPVHILIPIFCALPAARLGTSLEKYLRTMQGENHTRLVDWASQPEPSAFPASMIWASLGRKIGYESGLFFLLALLVTVFTALLVQAFPPALMSSGLSWSHLWSAALLGALPAVRIRRAYEVLVAGAVLICFLLLFLG
ncbi:MAG: PTS sugar transporter subunit IIC [Desulfovermiculus sp.]